MKLHNIILASSLSVLTLATSCHDWLDINHDPTTPEEVPLEQMLPGFVVNPAYTIMSYDFLFPMGIYNQYVTQRSGASQFKQTEQFYNENFSFAYINFFSSQLVEAKYFMDNTDSNSGRYAIAELMSIFVWQVAIDLWGPVAYTQAFDPNILEPVYDSDESIYDDLIRRINTVVSNFDNGVYNDDIPAKYDYLFDGDLEQWRLFANSLKLKILMRLLNTNKSSYADIKSFVESHDLLSITAQIPETLFETKSGKKYPLDEYEGSKQPTQNICPSSSISLYMEKDSRLGKVFSTDSNGDVVSKIQGSYETNSSNSSLDPQVKNLPLISTWEIYFNLAEVYLNTGDNAKAEDNYKKAIDESFAYWQLADKGDEVYGEDGYAPWANSVDENNRNINLQRWAAFLMTQHAEAFFNRLRTGIPSYYPQRLSLDVLTTNFPVGYLIYPVCGASIAGTPASMLYPNDYSLSLNSKSGVNQKKDISQPLFWHKK